MDVAAASCCCCCCCCCVACSLQDFADNDLAGKVSLANMKWRRNGGKTLGRKWREGSEKKAGNKVSADRSDVTPPAGPPARRRRRRRRRRQSRFSFSFSFSFSSPNSPHLAPIKATAMQAAGKAKLLNLVEQHVTVTSLVRECAVSAAADGIGSNAISNSNSKVLNSITSA